MRMGALAFVLFMCAAVGWARAEAILDDRSLGRDYVAASEAMRQWHSIVAAQYFFKDQPAREAPWFAKLFRDCLHRLTIGTLSMHRKEAVNNASRSLVALTERCAAEMREAVPAR